MLNVIIKLKKKFNMGILLREVYMTNETVISDTTKSPTDFKVPNGGNRLPYYRYYLINHKEKSLLHISDNLDEIKSMFNILGANPIFFIIRLDYSLGSVEFLENNEFKSDALIKMIYEKTLFFNGNMVVWNNKINDLNDLFLSLGKKRVL
jgi:hypothetical protein